MPPQVQGSTAPSPDTMEALVQQLLMQRAQLSLQKAMTTESEMYAQGDALRQRDTAASVDKHALDTVKNLNNRNNLGQGVPGLPAHTNPDAGRGFDAQGRQQWELRGPKDRVDPDTGELYSELETFNRDALTQNPVDRNPVNPSGPTEGEILGWQAKHLRGLDPYRAAELIANQLKASAAHKRTGALSMYGENI